MNEIQLYEMKMIMLEMLHYIDSECHRLEINYSLAYGTLIGAVRHKGFIPWDDDIDITMYREDYGKFINGFNSNGNFKLHCTENDSQYGFPFAKVEDSRTVLIENVNTSVPLGIYVDVFPIDNIADTYDESVKIYRKMSILKKIYRARLIRPSKKNVLYKRIIIHFLNTLMVFIPIKWLAKKIVDRCKRIRYNTRYVGIIVDNDSGVKCIFKRTDLEEYISVQFESLKVRGFKNYDLYLKQLYGDYMQLPPLNERTSPHTFISCYWK